MASQALRSFRATAPTYALAGALLGMVGYGLVVLAGTLVTEHRAMNAGDWVRFALQFLGGSGLVFVTLLIPSTLGTLALFGFLLVFPAALDSRELRSLLGAISGAVGSLAFLIFLGLVIPSAGVPWELLPWCALGALIGALVAYLLPVRRCQDAI